MCHRAPRVRGRPREQLREPRARAPSRPRKIYNTPSRSFPSFAADRRDDPPRPAPHPQSGIRRRLTFQGAPARGRGLAAARV